MLAYDSSMAYFAGIAVAFQAEPISFAAIGIFGFGALLLARAVALFRARTAIHIF
jgi:hypothetical protein